MQGFNLKNPPKVTLHSKEHECALNAYIIMYDDVCPNERALLLVPKNQISKKWGRLTKNYIVVCKSLSFRDGYEETGKGINTQLEVEITPKFNRLKGSKVYLCGAIDRVKDGGVGWRNDLKPFLHKHGMIDYDPCDKPTEKGVEDTEIRKEIERLKSIGAYRTIRDTYGDIRHIDLRMVDETKFLIVNLDIEHHACGTYEELFWANRCKKPVLVHVEQGKNAAPNWLFFALPHEFIFDDWDNLKEYVRHIDEDEKIDDLGRWVFFNK